MKKPCVQNRFAFYLMSLEFKLRDRFRPPETILEETGLQPGMAVLDLGCGPGGFSLAAAQQVGPKGIVYALDIHPLALQMVRRTAERKHLTNLRVLDGGELAVLPRHSVDLVLLYDVLHDLAEPEPVLAELHRVLRPAGSLSVSDHHLKDENIWETITVAGLFRFDGRRRWTIRFEKNEPAGRMEINCISEKGTIY